MNLIDEEWEPAPTDPALLRRVRAAVKGAVSPHDVGRLRAMLLAPPLRGAVPHEARGAVWLLLLGLRTEDPLTEDAGDFARAAREAVSDENGAEQIERDVERTRPGLVRFKQPAVRGALLRLLSLFCARRRVGYTQGLNELLAPFVLLADTGGNPRIVFSLFSAFLARFAPWMMDSSESRVFDVLKRAFKYFARLLLYHDPELYWRLDRESMTPDLYATSWFVTLFARNFTVQTVLALWDLLLLEDNPLGTCFFGLALLLSRRDKLLRTDSSRLPETLMLLGAGTPEEVQELWAAAGVLRAGHTPPSFQRLMSDRLLHPPGPPGTDKGLDAARCMQASVCLQTTPDDLSAGEAPYFTWDCRTREEYDSGHLAQAAFLELDELRGAGGVWQGDGKVVSELERVLHMCEPLRTSSHICLVGSGVKEEDDCDVNVLALFLTERGVPYVSTLRGGFRAAVAAASDDDDSLCSVELVDYDADAHETAVLRRRAVREAQAQRRAIKAAAARAMAAAQDKEAALRSTLNAAAGAAAGAAAAAFSAAAAGAGYGHGADGGRGRAEGPAEIYDPTAPSARAAAAAAADAEQGYAAMQRVLTGLGMKITGGLTSLAGPDLLDTSPDSATTGNWNPFSPNGSSSSPTNVLEEFATSSVTVGSLGSPGSGGSGGAGASGGASAPPALNGSGADLPPLRRSLSSVAAAAAGGLPTGPSGGGPGSPGALSMDSSPRMLEVPSSATSPKPGVAPGVSTDGESPIRKKGPARSGGGLFGNSKSPWGRDARPGWLSDESLGLPLSSMPKGFTVNVMDDRVMAGLRLFPCRARNDRALGVRGGKGGEFKRRYVGVCSNYFMLLSPHSTRTHLLEVKLIRFLQDIVRITFKRSRPELVTFEILGALEGDVPNEHIVCIMPDGLNECVELIKDYLGQKDCSPPPSPAAPDQPSDAAPAGAERSASPAEAAAAGEGARAHPAGGSSPAAADARSVAGPPTVPRDGAGAGPASKPQGEEVKSRRPPSPPEVRGVPASDGPRLPPHEKAPPAGRQLSEEQRVADDPVEEEDIVSQVSSTPLNMSRVKDEGGDDEGGDDDGVDDAVDDDRDDDRNKGDVERAVPVAAPPRPVAALGDVESGPMHIAPIVVRPPALPVELALSSRLPSSSAGAGDGRPY